ncbi:MAG: HAD family phosphatase [Longicatena sp.]
MKIKGILFDFNGTMFFDGPKHSEAWNVFSLKFRNKPISEEELQYLHGQTNKQIIKLLLERTLPDDESERLSKEKEAFYRQCCIEDPTSFHLVDGLVELLDKLKEMQVPMTICSASIKDNIDFFIESFHLDTWFDCDNIIYDDGTHANKISMFLDGARNIKVPIEQCLIFEDSISGLQFANDVHAGKIVAINTPNKKNDFKKIKRIDQVIDDYTNFDVYS